MDIDRRVSEYLDYCRYRRELDEKTIKAYRIDLRQFFERFCYELPDKAGIESYVTELHRTYMQRTVKRKIASIRALYAYWEDEGIVAENPFRRVRVGFKEIQTLPRIIPRGEIERLLNYMYASPDRARQEKYWLRDMAVVETLFATGARVYEVSGIRLENVDLPDGFIRIMGKGGKERYVQIGDECVLSLLGKYYEENADAIRRSGYFFVNRRGGRYTEQSMRIMIKKYALAAGLERNITPHMFRHSFATYLIEEGADISCVQQILGHSSIRTTQIYIHVAAEKQARILKELHPRNRMKIEVGDSAVRS